LPRIHGPKGCRVPPIKVPLDPLLEDTSIHSSYTKLRRAELLDKIDQVKSGFYSNSRSSHSRLGIALVFITFIFSMNLIFIYIMFLVIMFIVYFDYMLSIVKVIIVFMPKITERSSRCSNRLSSRTLCKRGAYTLFCLWLHPAVRKVW
jgi:hypothetical protein